MKKWLIALIICSLTSIASAEIEWRRYDYFNNSGGLNDSASPIAIGDNQSPELQNVVFTTSGSWKTRDGSERIGYTGSSSACTGVKYYSPTSGSKYLVAIFTNNKIYKMDYTSAGPDGTLDDITGSLSFTVTQNDLASFAVGQDTLIIEDGLNTTAPYKWTGSGNAAALGGSPPNAKIVAYHKRMAFAAGNNSNPSTLYFSDVGDIENWTSGLSGNVSVETNDGTVIRAIAPGFDALYIFKDNSIWRLTGTDKDTFVLQRMVSDIGVGSPKAVSLIGNEFIIVSDQGHAYIYDGAISVKLISTAIDGTLEGANFNRFAYTVSEIFDDDFYFALSNSGSGTHNRLMVYDTFNQAWTKFVGMNVNAMTVADNGSGQDILVFGDYSGRLFKYPSGEEDDGGKITTTYVTKQYRFQEGTALKDWKLLKVFANQQGNYTMLVETRKDFETTGTTVNLSLQGTSSIWGTAVYGVDKYGGQNLIVGRVEVNLDEGNFFQIKFSQTQLPIEVKGWQCFVEDNDRL